MARKRAESIKNVLARTLKAAGFAERLNQDRAVAIFAETVGPEIARRAEAISIDRGKLLVKVESPVWRLELSYSRQELIDKLNAALGEAVVTDIHFLS